MTIVILWGIFHENMIIDSLWWKYSLLNPIIKYSEWTELMEEKEIDMKSIIEKYINQRISKWDAENISVYYRALNNGDWIGINEKEYFSPASQMKIPVLIAYLKKAESEKGLLSEKLLYQKNERDTLYNQNIASLKELEDGKEYTIKELLEYMIRYSSNTAAYMLRDNISIENIKATFYDLWMGYPELIEWSFDNNIRIKDGATFFRVLFNASYLNKAHSERALELMSFTEFNSGLRANIPTNIMISHKFGERWIIWKDGKEQKQLHDWGIVYFKDHPYILNIMTRWEDREKLKETIQGLSDIIYQEVEKKYSK